MVSAFMFAACRSNRADIPPAHVGKAADAININKADVDELRRIPNIGEKLAVDIIEFRLKNGPFRRTEHLLLINGISDRRFREIRHLVRIE
jgi:competence protein ComEA